MPYTRTTLPGFRMFSGSSAVLTSPITAYASPAYFSRKAILP